MPQLSVLLPNYNHAHFLPTSVGALLTQEYTDFEILIGDDASTDNSREVISAFAAQDPRIRPFFFEKNQGVNKMVDQLLAYAQGTYIYAASADDYVLPGFFQKLMTLLLAHPDLDLACCNLRCFHHDNPQHTHDSNLLKGCMAPLYIPKEKILDIYRNQGFCVSGPTVISKKTALSAQDCMPAYLNHLSDWIIFNIIALKSGAGFVPETLVAMRVIASSYGASVKKNRDRKRNTYWAVLNHVWTKESVETRRRVYRSGLLTIISDNLFWKLFYYPKYWCLFFYAKSSFWGRIKHSLLKRFFIRRPLNGSIIRS